MFVFSNACWQDFFYTHANENRVSCCLYSGEPVWEFKNETVLKNPRGITVDNKGNVFVVGMDSGNILVISSDGKQYQQIQNRTIWTYKTECHIL